MNYLNVQRLIFLNPLAVKEQDAFKLKSALIPVELRYESVIDVRAYVTSWLLDLQQVVEAYQSPRSCAEEPNGLQREAQSTAACLMTPQHNAVSVLPADTPPKQQVCTLSPQSAAGVPPTWRPPSYRTSSMAEAQQPLWVLSTVLSLR